MKDWKKGLLINVSLYEKAKNNEMKGKERSIRYGKNLIRRRIM